MGTEKGMLFCVKENWERQKGEWQMKQKHRLLVLFLKTLYISAFTFGGGFVIVTFMKKCFVDELHWIDEQ